MKDLKFFCNKIINNWIIYLILDRLGKLFLSIILFGTVIGAFTLLLINEGIVMTNFYIPLFSVLIFVHIVIFIYIIQFELRVLLDLKQFIARNAVCFFNNNSIKTVTESLDCVCRYLLKSTDMNVPELSRLVNNFKRLIYKKEDR